MSPVATKLLALLKPFMNKELLDVFHFNTLNSDTLFDYLEKDDLLNDYEGNWKIIQRLDQEGWKQRVSNLSWLQMASVGDFSVWLLTRADHKTNGMPEGKTWLSMTRLLHLSRSL